MAEELMLKVEDVYKKYRLGTIGGGTLTADLQSWWARVRHKEDPNSKIGAKTYGKNEVFYALNGISFEVRKGEALGIIGGNGAGKSTTLKLISQVTAPTKGKIYLNGRITSMLEVGTGFHPELTGRENIYLNGAILGMTKAEIDRKIEEIIDFSECRQFIDTPVKRYSSGMYVKLAFSVAAHLDSEIMIMDEVLAVGDMAFQKKCIDKMKSISTGEGRTILYVSHNMNTIRQLCDRCVVLDKGKVIFDGDVEKGISVYSKSMIEDKVYFDFTDYSRSPNETRKLELLSLQLSEKKNSDFVKNEKTKIVIKARANADCKDIGIRLEILSGDGSAAGTLFMNKKISASKGQILEIDTILDLAHLAPGKYYVAMLTYENDELGNQVGVDRVCPAMYINMQQDHELLWLSQWWGNSRFNDLDCIEIKGINES